MLIFDKIISLDTNFQAFSKVSPEIRIHLNHAHSVTFFPNATSDVDKVGTLDK